MHFIRPAAKDDIIRQFRFYLLEGAVETAAAYRRAKAVQKPDSFRPAGMGCKRI